MRYTRELLRLQVKFKEWLVLFLVKGKVCRTFTTYSDGNHRVPNVNANSDGDFNFNLGNFENDWNSDNCLLCFCDSYYFSCYHLVGVFSCRFFFQPPEHSSDFIQLEYDVCVNSMIKSFMLPADLKKKLQQISLCD